MQTAFKCFQNHTLGSLLNPTAGFFLTKLTLKVHLWSKRFWSSYFSQVRTTTYAGIFSTWLVQLITFMAGIRSEVSSMPFLCRTLTSICIYIYGYESSCSQFSVTTAWQCTEILPSLPSNSEGLLTLLFPAPESGIWPSWKASTWKNKLVTKERIYSYRKEINLIVCPSADIFSSPSVQYMDTCRQI